MLRLIPVPLHRALYRLAHAGRCLWLRRTGGTVHGVSVIAQDEQGRVLLVRHSYGSGVWCFPGGGLRQGEDPALAARREFDEELGCALAHFAALGVVDEPFHGATNRVHLFTGRCTAPPRPDGRELVDAAYFALAELPAQISATVTSRLAVLARR